MSSKSRSTSPKSPSKSPPPAAEEVEVKNKREPIRAPTRSPSPIPQRTHRASRSPTPDGNERDEVMSVHSDDERESRRRSSRSPRRRDARRDRSRSRDRRDSNREREGRHKRERSRSRDRRRHSRSKSPKRPRRESPVKEKEAEKEAPKKEKKEPLDLLRTRAGGAYIPPAKLKLMQEMIADKTGEQYQRMNWERLKKKIHGLVNKVNTGNLVSVVRSLLQENVIRGKGLLSRSIIQAQAFSPVFSNVYAALVAVINSKFPHIGELILRRLIVQFKRSFRRNDKGTTVTVSKFIAHLINQQVAHELLALEIIILMLETPTDDSVEVSIAFLKECGAKLLQVAPKALLTVFDRLRNILHESESGNLDKRIQYMIEVVMTVRKDGFKAFPAVIDDLDLIEEDDQITHTITLEDAVDPENTLNVFKLDEDFEKNEAMYDQIRKEIIGDDDYSDEEDGEGDDDENDEGEEGEGGAPAVAAPSGTTEIIDNTEQNLVAFRREVYLTIQSSLDYQEAAHKLLKMRVKKELESELCHMLVDCCTQNRTYERFYGLLCERFCRLKKEFQMTFEQVARDTYATVHRFEITKLRNMSRLISHLLFTDAISWMVLSDIRLTEEDTTSSGRIYIKYIFQELCESMGLIKLYERVMDPTLQNAFAGIFPRDNPQNSRFAINFFTLIGLGGLTVDLREFLEKGAKKQKETAALAESSDDTDTDSSDSSSGSDDSDSDSSSSSSDSDSEDEKRRRKKKAAAKKKASKKNDKKKKSKKDVKEEKENRKDKRHREAEVDRRVKDEPSSPARSPARREKHGREVGGVRGGERDRDESPPRRDTRDRRGDDREEERTRTEKQSGRRDREERRRRSGSRERKEERDDERVKDREERRKQPRREDSRSPKRDRRRDRSASVEKDRGDRRVRTGGDRRRERSRS